MLETLRIVKNAQSNMYAKCILKSVDFSPEEENSEYYAHTFTLQDKNSLFISAKKTPTKAGWYITIWKRGADNIITPYGESDAIDFVVIAASKNHSVGKFILPKTILEKKNIFRVNGKEGKRETMVHTSLDKTTSAQAAKTQKWKNRFFTDLRALGCESALKINNLYSM